MQLSQLITKVVPVQRADLNYEICEDINTDENIAYLFTNLAFRSAHKIEMLKCVKCIYDLQNSILFLFCDREYRENFIESIS